MILDADINSRLRAAITRAWVGTPITWYLNAADYRAVHQAREAAARFVSANQPAEPRLLGLPYVAIEGELSKLTVRRRDTGAVEEIPV